MNRQILPFALLLTLAAPAARAQVHLQIELGLPVVPPLVLIQPGIQVVEGFREEVFFHRGWYWCRRPDGWYRARSPRARFEWVEVHRVPGALIRVPTGRYRDWHHDHDARPQDRRAPERRELRRDERRDEHRDERGRERRDERGRERGNDHGREGEDHRRRDR